MALYRSQSRVRSLLCGVVLGLIAVPLVAVPVQAAGPKPQPFASNNGQIPPASAYNGPLFALSYDYPATAPVPAMPWRSAIQNGPITTANAGAYAQALKAAVGADMQVLLQDYGHWNAAQRGWYNEPWLASEREAIHGMYVGSSSLDTSLFAATGLSKPLTTYVLTYYNQTAAPTLARVWGKTAMQPNLTPKSTQFAEGAIIVKAAFITAGPNIWPVMQGSQVWPLYITVDATTGQLNQPAVVPTYLMQFDIIVKDSVSAPKTGWVFSTLVYDQRVAPGPNGIWDQMVVLGAQWGNDPQANDPNNPQPVLVENWNNPAAPAYGGATFGWGERLSGPNDGAMNDISYVDANGQRQFSHNAKDSSCMSCHSSAQWNVQTRSMPSFLLPLTTAQPNPSGAGAPYLDSPAPGSVLWMKWFQNRQGDQPMDAGSVATDFDMVLPFKSLPMWAQAMKNQQGGVAKGPTPATVRREYNGRLRH